MIQNNEIDFKTKKLKYRYNSDVYFLFRISIRISLFIFFLLASLIVLYVIGNIQQFQDESQKLILNLSAIVCAIEFIFSIFSIALNIVTYFIVKRKFIKTFVYSLFFLFTLALSVAVFLVSRAILLASQGF